MKSKKHILILTPGFPRNESDSTCIPPLQALIRAMQTAYLKELHLSVVTFQYPFEKGYYDWNGIRCWSAGGSNKGFPSKLVTWFRVMKFVLELNRQEPIQIIHSFWLHDCALVGQWISKLTGARHVAHAMGQDVLTSNPYRKFLNTGKMQVIANSPFTDLMLRQNLKIASTCIIPFGLNPDDFSRISLSKRRIDLLSVGSLTEIKNHKLFIEIFKELKKTIPTLTGCIIGAGPLAGKLSEEIHSLKLDDCLFLEGALPHSEVLKRMSESKILLHTAPFESAGYVFLEALYSGMKVVSFETGFLPEVKSAFPCKDKSIMIDRIKKLLDENQEYEKEEVPLIADSAAEIFKIYSQF